MQARPGYRIKRIGPPDACLEIEVPDALSKVQLTDVVSHLLEGAETDDALRARITELESREPEIREVEKIVERVVEAPVPAVEADVDWPEPGDRLTDWDVVGEPAEPAATVEDLINLLRTDPAAADAKITGLSSRQRKFLTDSFKERMNELNNRRLRAIKLNDMDGAWLEDHQTLYHKLAETGDGA